LQRSAILAGARQFVANFHGTLVTETMLVAGANDSPARLAETADLLAQLRPDIAYLSIPTRPPAEDWVLPPDEAVINRAYQLFSDRLKQVEYLIGYEGNAFAFSGDVEDDLLSITAVHPMREDAVKQLITQAKAPWSVVQRLITEGQLIETQYNQQTFYLRKIHS